MVWGCKRFRASFGRTKVPTLSCCCCFRLGALTCCLCRVKSLILAYHYEGWLLTAASLDVVWIQYCSFFRETMISHFGGKEECFCLDASNWISLDICWFCCRHSYYHFCSFLAQTQQIWHDGGCCFDILKRIL